MLICFIAYLLPSDSPQHSKLPPRCKNRQGDRNVKDSNNVIELIKPSSIKSKQNESDSTVEERITQKNDIILKPKQSQAAIIEHETFTELCENLKVCEEGTTAVIKASNYRGSNQGKTFNTPMNLSSTLSSKLMNSPKTKEYTLSTKKMAAVLYNDLLPNEMNCDLNY